MNSSKDSLIVRLFASTLLVAAIIGLSVLAVHAPAQSQSPVTLKSIRTDRASTLYANQSPNCAWFVEMVLPADNSKLADRGPSCAWFVEMVLPTTDSDLMTENLKSVAATL
jgi:hypothetical protein